MGPGDLDLLLIEYLVNDGGFNVNFEKSPELARARPRAQARARIDFTATDHLPRPPLQPALL